MRGHETRGFRINQIIKDVVITASFFMRKLCVHYAQSIRIIKIQQKVYKITKELVVIWLICILHYITKGI